MNDPHVEWLRYRVELGPTLSSTTDPSPKEYEVDGFVLQLEAGKLTIPIKEHHPSVESASDRVTPLLRSWELDTDLTYGPRALRFIYEDSKVIDRDPPPPGTSRPFIHLASGGLELGGSAEMSFVPGRLREFPPPPVTFRTTHDVETLWHHYESHLADKERLTDMGFYCLTVIERIGGGRARAASKFQIDFSVLQKLGELSSARGDAKTARKSMPQPKPFRRQEETWIRNVVRAFVRRVGEHAASAPLKKLSLADFPPLP